MEGSLLKCENKDRSGFIFSYSDRIRKQISVIDFEKFSKLPSDEARFEFISNYTGDKPIEAATLATNNKKDLPLANNLKKIGNSHFQNSQWRDALNYYSQSLIQTPKENVEEISILYANRSAALYHLQNYKGSLKDMSRAISHNYPDHLLHKVRERQARCYLALKQSAEALRSFKQTVQTLDLSKLPLEKRAKLEKDAQVMIKLLQREEELLLKQNKQKPIAPKTPTQEKEDKMFINPNLMYGYNEEEGRFGVAKSKINVAEPLIVENPHCSVLLESFSKSHCDSCFRRVTVPIPCEDCVNVIYCSDNCQIKAKESFHKYECKSLSTIWASGISVTCHMALRIMSQKTVDHFLTLKDDLKNDIQPNDWNSYANADYRKVYCMVTHASSRSAEDLFQRTIIAKFLLGLLEAATYFQNNKETYNQLETKMFIGGLILHNLQMLQMNAHEIAELQQATAKDSGASVFIGGGLYPTLAMLNHSCEPGIVRYYRGNTVHVHAIKNIKPGEGIAENYGQIFTQTEREQRQRVLKDQYKFDCRCIACTSNWPLYKNMDTSVMRFKCAGEKNCSNTLIIPVDVKDFLIKCTECGEFTNIMKGLKALQDTDTLFKTAIRHHDAGDSKKALVKYVEMMKILDENLAPPFRDYHVCQQGIRRCFLELGNRAIVK